ncbi:hypothetical protein HZS_5370 [Henneguya salminicola]|uniref:Ribosome biogenesis protein BRX1 homolog n=1 Tax=Henneguya salminicola TaxID=69463 RepID=A0A6G3MHJ6_HENSL|nr:hypothetical protein HZS_5370 [Henneguya salminicola]
MKEEVSANEINKKEEKLKVLIFCQSGITANVRVFSKNLLALLPHSRPEMKYGNDGLPGIAEVLSLRNANRCIFFQVKKRRDVYAWMCCYPDGPTIKFLVENIETLDRNFAGNCYIGTRAILSFSEEFDNQGIHLKLIKELLTQLFQTPPYIKSSKFVDHVFHFSLLDGRIWFRNYQLSFESDTNKLTEIGPRFTLNPIAIFKGIFCGKILYKNSKYIPPSLHFKLVTEQAVVKTKKRIEKRASLKDKAESKPHFIDEINQVFQSK